MGIYLLLKLILILVEVWASLEFKYRHRRPQIFIAARGDGFIALKIDFLANFETVLLAKLTKITHGNGARAGDSVPGNSQPRWTLRVASE